ncbi:MAG TPA: GGDEF domain-containing protein, partial [Lachnospiraceae bacterium]|nr:GGDEF domain-containing protein [Lachnospiraceae bacterium]
NIAIMMLALLLTAAFILRFASNIVMVIKKMMEFLKEMSLGNLSTQLSPVVVNREDELGEMGNFTVKVQASLRKLIERDVLTGLYNRRSGENMLDKVKAGGMTYAVAIGDIDFFKKFNDNFGHDCGDVVLKEVAAVLDNGMRGIGFVARWGGEEFLLVFDNMNGLAAGVEADRILQMVRENTVRYNGQEHTVTMTFGVAEGNAEKPINIQIKEADEKLYRGKESGRNRVIV